MKKIILTSIIFLLSFYSYADQAYYKPIYNPQLRTQDMDMVLDTAQDISLSSDLTLSGSTSNLYIEGFAHIDQDLTLGGTATLSDLNIETPTVPTASSSAGTAGDIAWDEDYIYICTATNYWERVAIATWAVTDKLLLSDGTSHILLSDGSSKILIRP